MNRLISAKILILIAVWILTGGLSFADSFDLTDELQDSFAVALETDLDELRESVEDAPASFALSLTVLRHEHASSLIPLSMDLLIKAAMRPLQEVLRTLRI